VAKSRWNVELISVIHHPIKCRKKGLVIILCPIAAVAQTDVPAFQRSRGIIYKRLAPFTWNVCSVLPDSNLYSPDKSGSHMLATPRSDSFTHVNSNNHFTPFRHSRLRHSHILALRTPTPYGQTIIHCVHSFAALTPEGPSCSRFHTSSYLL
jgi:hypothetical protein